MPQAVHSTSSLAAAVSSNAACVPGGCGDPLIVRAELEREYLRVSLDEYLGRIGQRPAPPCTAGAAPDEVGPAYRPFHIAVVENHHPRCEHVLIVPKAGYGWKLVTTTEDGLSVLPSTDLAELASCEQCDWPGNRTSSMNVLFETEPVSNLRIGQFLAHDQPEGPEVVREHASQLWDDLGGNLTLTPPDQADLAQIPLGSPGEIGALFLLALYQDAGYDGVHTTEPILAISFTATVYAVQPDGLGYRWYSVTYGAVRSPPEGPFPLSIDSTVAYQP